VTLPLSRTMPDLEEGDEQEAPSLVWVLACGQQMVGLPAQVREELTRNALAPLVAARVGSTTVAVLRTSEDLDALLATLRGRRYLYRVAADVK